VLLAAPTRRSAAFALVLTLLLAACGSGDSTGDGATSPADGAGSTPDIGEDEPTLAPPGARSYYSTDVFGGRVIRIDPDSGDVVEIAELDGPAYAMTAGDGALWLGLDSGGVVRVEPADGTTTTIETTVAESIFAIAHGDGGVWALHGAPGLEGAVSRIDPASATAATPITGVAGTTFFALATGEGSAWVVGSSPTMATTLYEIDPASDTLTDREVQMLIDSVAVGEGSVWLGGSIFPDGLNGVPGIGRFDPATGTLATFEVTGEAGAITVGAGAIWAVAGVTPDGMVVYRIDPATNAVAATIPVGPGDSGRVSITTGAGFVWVATPNDVWVIDPTDDSVAGAGGSPGSIGLFFP
jgi:hypothetical protein